MKFNLRPASFIITVFSVLVFCFLIYAAANSVDDEYKNPKVVNGDAAVTNIWLHNYSKIEKLRDNNIKYLIVDIGGISDNGKPESSFSEIESFVNRIKYFEEKENYDFIILPYSEIDSYKIDITSETFRENFLMTNKNLVAMGFDGIFLDIEPVRLDQRDSFLNLIDETRSELPEDSIIAVYSGAWSYNNDNEWEWNYAYMKKVSKKADVISYPGYDTGINDSDEYISYIKKQVKKVNQWYSRDNFWFGIPTHKESPETPKNALLTYNTVLNSTSKTPFIGIAIFSEWTADDQDWIAIKKFRNRTWT
jgi:hypothetical protein